MSPGWKRFATCSLSLLVVYLAVVLLLGEPLLGALEDSYARDRPDGVVYRVRDPPSRLEGTVLADLLAIPDRIRSQSMLYSLRHHRLRPTAPRLHGRWFEGLEVSQQPYLIDHVVALSRRLGFDVVDLYRALAPFAAQELLYWRDDNHWNVRGNLAAAEIPAERLGRTPPEAATPPSGESEQR
jgi:hypothetical protein